MPRIFIDSEYSAPSVAILGYIQRSDRYVTERMAISVLSYEYRENITAWLIWNMDRRPCPAHLNLT